MRDGKRRWSMGSGVHNWAKRKSCGSFQSEELKESS